MLKNLFAFIFLLLFFNNNSSAQSIDSSLNKFSNDYAQEKIYIHFDKYAYNKGETIWFKAYIMDGNMPSTQSKNFYADWYDDKGDLVRHDAFPIFQSTAKGQLVIPEKYTGNSLHIKAYTKWMLNFDSAFLFSKYITIIQSKTQQEQSTNIKTKIDFFPEGGEIIHGIGSFVAFKATNQYGLPIHVNGIVKNNLGEFIDSIKTDHDGMGTVYINNPNVQQQYAAYYTDEFTGIEHTKQLPTVTLDGVAMQVQNLGKVSVVTIKRTEAVSDDKKYVKLFAFMNEEVVFKAIIKLANKTTQTLQIPTDSFPTGVLQLTLFNDNYLPLSERIVFVKNDNYQFSPSIKTLTTSLTKRGKNVIDIDIPDSLFSNMSLSITDANIAVDSTTNIFSQLLLTGDLKGNVYNPSYYFLNNDETTLQHLDLVMLTNGWRKYNWQQIINGKMPYTKYKKDSTYLQIAGNTFGIDKSDLLQNPNILLISQAKDSSRKQLILPIRKDFSFGKSNFIFYDSLKVYYTFLGSNKLNRSAEVVFNNGLFNSPSKTNLDTIISKYVAINFSFFDKQKKLDEEYNRLVKLKGSGVLQEVIVKTKARPVVDALDNTYATGMFNGGDAYQFDVTNDVRAQSAQTVFTYLQGLVPGLQILQQEGETVAKWRHHTTDFFLDEMLSDADMVGSINMNDIAYIKVFKPPFFGGRGGSPGGAIAVYTRKGADVKSTPGKGISFKYLEGYTAYKEFYTPNYEKQNDASLPDVRTTLYWNPYILADASKKKTTIEFYNNDVSKKLRVVLCGMNAEGKLAWIEKTIE